MIHLFHHLVYAQAIGAVLAIAALIAFVWGPKRYRPIASAIIFANIAFGGVALVIHHHLEAQVDEQRDALNRDLTDLGARMDAEKLAWSKTVDPQARRDLREQLNDIARELAKDRKRLDEIRRMEAEEL